MELTQAGKGREISDARRRISNTQKVAFAPERGLWIRGNTVSQDCGRKHN
jgi:hypothetical protein